VGHRSDPPAKGNRKRKTNTWVHSSRRIHRVMGGGDKVKPRIMSREKEKGQRGREKGEVRKVKEGNAVIKSPRKLLCGGRKLETLWEEN